MARLKKTFLKYKSNPYYWPEPIKLMREDTMRKCAFQNGTLYLVRRRLQIGRNGRSTRIQERKLPLPAGSQSTIYPSVDWQQTLVDYIRPHVS